MILRMEEMKVMKGERENVAQTTMLNLKWKLFLQSLLCRSKMCRTFLLRQRLLFRQENYIAGTTLSSWCSDDVDILNNHDNIQPENGFMSINVAFLEPLIVEAIITLTPRIDTCEKMVLDENKVTEQCVDHLYSIVPALQSIHGLFDIRRKVERYRCQGLITPCGVLLDKLMSNGGQRSDMEQCNIEYFTNKSPSST